MDAEETCVLWLDRDAEQLTFGGQGARDCWVAAPFSTEVRAILANPEAPMRPTRSYRAQQLMQGLAHRGSLFQVERVHGSHQSFERIARECFVTLVGQSQTDASPVRFRSLSDQVPTCLKCLDSLRRSAAGGRLKRRECRRGSGEGIGAGEVAERHPLGGAEFAVIALSLHKPPYQQQELCRFACGHGHLSGKVIVFRNQIDNGVHADNLVSKLVGGEAARDGWRSWVVWRALIGASRLNPASPAILRKSGGSRCWNRTKSTCSPSAGASTATTGRRTSSSIVICASLPGSPGAIAAMACRSPN